ncbi:unnamed protein product [Owenia fusiformis]|uniref:Uncharacterized protein n=1 Tax=Owenia fusiformis TaxID=6347 RepID=A0A8S4N030_OWEFU|nr:unnamed protein product [Owenia fusiformis]
MIQQLFLGMFMLMFIKDLGVDGRLHTGSRREAIVNHLCKNGTCSKDHFCNNRNICRRYKFDGEPCKSHEYCKSGICLNQTCRACRVDDDCPSRGEIHLRKYLPKIFPNIADDEAYCLDNDCVACKLDDHCKAAMVCTSDNRCEECDSDEDCVDGFCSKAGAHNWCVQCYNDTHCPDSQKCSYGKCVECKEDSDCSTGRCHLAECVSPVCNGVCSSDSGCISGSCYRRSSFHRGSRTKLFGYCKSCN